MLLKNFARLGAWACIILAKIEPECVCRSVAEADKLFCHLELFSWRSGQRINFNPSEIPLVHVLRFGSLSLQKC